MRKIIAYQLLATVIFCLFAPTSAFSYDGVTVQGDGVSGRVFLGMTKLDLINSIGAPSRIKSEGYCMQYDAFDISVFLDKDMVVERIYLGRGFRGQVDGGTGYPAAAGEPLRAQGAPERTGRLTYTPSPMLQNSATVELEDRVQDGSNQNTAFPVEYRGNRQSYELTSHGVTMKRKYVSDSEGMAYYVDDKGAVYATVIYPPSGRRRAAVQAGLEPASLGSVYFDFDKYNIKREYRGVLDHNAEYLKDKRDLKVSVAGHTDAMGTYGYNQGLSERRANSVYNYLKGKGVPESQMNMVGYSEGRPIADNKTKEGRARNRRVEMTAEPVYQAPSARDHGAK